MEHVKILIYMSTVPPPKNILSRKVSHSQDFLCIHMWSQVIVLLNYIFNYIIFTCKHICAYVGTQLHLCYKKQSLFAFVFSNYSYQDMVARCVQFCGFCSFFTANMAAGMVTFGLHMQVPAIYSSWTIK